MTTPVLRVARPSDHLEEVARQYRLGMGLAELARFEDHDGFDGIILGSPGASYHLEFTRKHGHAAGHAPTQDNLLVLYLPDPQEWAHRCREMVAAGFKAVTSFNPYWDRIGKTFEDLDGYRVVIQNAGWET